MNKDEERKKKAAAYARMRRARIRNGEIGPYQRVPGDEAKRLFLAARAEGVSLGLLESTTGLSKTTLQRIARRPDADMAISTERALLRGVPLARHRTRFGELTPRRLDVEPYRTKMRRLGAAGWSLKPLLRSYGLSDQVTRDRARYISPEDAEVVDRIYAEYESKMGTNLQTARFWRGRGYLVPSAESPEDMLGLPPTERQKRLRAKRRRLRKSA